jgi:HIV Tat-specific factor 1
LNYGFIDNTTAPTTTTTKDVDEKKSESIAMPQTEELSKQLQDEEEEEDDDDESKQLAGKKRKAPAAPPKWFEIAPEQNTKVYVSNLPLDITEDEFAEVMAKCGMVMKDVKTGKLKLKLYRDSNGQMKGDGLCHYIKVSQSINSLF